MPESYKLAVKLGTAEFTAEGPEETVKDAFQQFLRAVPAHVTTAPPSGDPEGETPELGSAPPKALIDRVFNREGDIVTLRHLPPQDSPSRAADAAILLLYGFRTVLAQEDVPVTKLIKALKKSGVSVNRLDRVIGVHAALFMKGGSRSGGRYTLNNQGANQASAWLTKWFQKS